MYSNNPIVIPVCFDCIQKELKYNSIKDADVFCRTYNIPFDPELWMRMADQLKGETFREYAAAFFTEAGVYKSENGDTWDKVNSEWTRIKKQRDILDAITPIKEAYIERESLVWGSQYSFQELIELDSLYTQSIQANNITNPLQKKSLKTLLKVMVDMDKAILQHDSGELKNLSSTYSTLAKTAQLDEMIEDTHTDDITTLAEVTDVLENAGFDMPFYDGAARDAIDMAIQNIQESNSRTIKDSTGLGPLIEELMEKKRVQDAAKMNHDAISKTSLSTMEEIYKDPIDGFDIASEIAEEDDNTITDEKFEEDE